MDVKCCTEELWKKLKKRWHKMALINCIKFVEHELRCSFPHQRMQMEYTLPILNNQRSENAQHAECQVLSRHGRKYLKIWTCLLSGLSSRWPEEDTVVEGLRQCSSVLGFHQFRSQKANTGQNLSLSVLLKSRDYVWRIQGLAPPPPSVRRAHQGYQACRHLPSSSDGA